MSSRIQGARLDWIDELLRFDSCDLIQIIVSLLRGTVVTIHIPRDEDYIQIPVSIHGCRSSCPPISIEGLVLLFVFGNFCSLGAFLQSLYSDSTIHVPFTFARLSLMEQQHSVELVAGSSTVPLINTLSTLLPVMQYEEHKLFPRGKQ